MQRSIGTGADGENPDQKGHPLPKVRFDNLTGELPLFQGAAMFGFLLDQSHEAFCGTRQNTLVLLNQFWLW